MLKNTIILIKSFIVSLAFIAIFVFINALFVNWSLLTNLCVAIVVSCFGVTLWKWTFNIIAFKRSGMKLPEESKKDDDDIIFCPLYSNYSCNVHHDKYHGRFDSDLFSDNWDDNSW